MNKINFISAAMHINNPIDCRRLTLSLSFYQLDQERVTALSNQLIRWLYNITGTDFVYECYYDYKRSNIKKLLSQLSEKFNSTRGLSAGFDAYAVSPVVYNSATFRKYRKFVCYENPAALFNVDMDPQVSTDYRNFLNQLFPAGRPTDLEIPGLVHKIFGEPNRVMTGYHNEADLAFSIHADAYQKQADRYYGSAEISFSAFCLGASVNSMAEALAHLLLLVADTFRNVCGHVSLQPTSKSINQYMKYFGSYLLHDGSHEEAGCSIKEWYPTYYLCGVEWMNILSPLAKQHVANTLRNPPCNDSIGIQELSGGGLAIRSLQPIMRYATTDAYALKQILLPALYPGGSSIPLKGLFPPKGMPRIYEWCPRNDWAIVPVERDEIDVVGGNIVFTSLSAQL